MVAPLYILTNNVQELQMFFTLPGYDGGSYFNFSPSDEYVVNGIFLWSWFVFCNDVNKFYVCFHGFPWRFFFSTKLSKPSKSYWIMTPIPLISIHWFGRHHKLELLFSFYYSNSLFYLLQEAFLFHIDFKLHLFGLLLDILSICGYYKHKIYF